MPSTPERIAIVTGPTSGIGLATARALSERGMRVVLVGRSVEKLEAVAASLRGPVETVVGDLERLEDVRAIARELLVRCPRIDVLVNNAGAVFTDRKTTVDGFERTFALNHLAPFLLTGLLLPRIRETPGARVVTVASHAHFMIDDLFWEDLQLAKRWGRRGWDAYCQSKLANILFTRELAKKLAPGQAATCVHPGWVRTGLGTNNGLTGRLLVPLISRFARSPEKGAETVIWAATADEAASLSGEYLYDLAPTKRSRAARDDARAKRLWDLSARLVGLPVSGNT